jgi:hypothetical protein
MSTVDAMLDGDEPIVQHLIAEAGPITADQFVSEFNNACMQMAGFEDAYQLIQAYDHDMFFAPMANMSYTEH